MNGSREPDRGNTGPDRHDALAGPVITAGIVVAGVGGVVLLIAAVAAQSVVPAILGAVALACAALMGGLRGRNRL